MCWYCHWGWPEPVANIFLEAKAKLDGDEMPLLYGPGHIVWEDCNFDSARWCLDNFERYAQDSLYTKKQLEIVKWSLEKLVELPETVYQFEDMNYDNPELSPPPENMKMIFV